MEAIIVNSLDQKISQQQLDDMKEHNRIKYECYDKKHENSSLARLVSGIGAAVLCASMVLGNIVARAYNPHATNEFRAYKENSKVLQIYKQEKARFAHTIPSDDLSMVFVNEKIKELEKDIQYVESNKEKYEKFKKYDYWANKLSIYIPGALIVLIWGASMAFAHKANKKLDEKMEKELAHLDYNNKWGCNLN